jgi:hypothetical protein
MANNMPPRWYKNKGGTATARQKQHDILNNHNNGNDDNYDLSDNNNSDDAAAGSRGVRSIKQTPARIRSTAAGSRGVRSIEQTPARIRSGRPRRPSDQGSVENMNKLVKRVLGSTLAERRLAGEDPNWT